MEEAVDWTAQDKAYIAGTYARLPLGIEKGEGQHCTDWEGKEYIDFSSGIGVNSLGFGNPQWIKAVTNQLHKLSHMSNLYYTKPQIQLAKELCQRTGMQKVFFANSGAEANEGAIKAARKYSSDAYGAERYEIITLKNSFHGRTLATLAATGQEVFHQHFGPFPEGFVYTEANNLSQLLEAISPKTCAIFIELIQGEGGVIPLEPSFVEAIQAVCQEKDILLLVDEVQTGVGRTGKLLCSQWYDLQPDIVTLAKGLGGGLPIGAVLFGEKTKDTLGAGDHATTFGGNPVITAGGTAVLDTLTPSFLEEVVAKGEFLQQGLQKIEGIGQVSGKGLMLGAELIDDFAVREVLERLASRGVILLSAKEKLRFLPPLTITKEEIEKGLVQLKEVLKEMKDEAFTGA